MLLVYVSLEVCFQSFPYYFIHIHIHIITCRCWHIVSFALYHTMFLSHESSATHYFSQGQWTYHSFMGFVVEGVVQIETFNHNPCTNTSFMSVIKIIS